MTTASPLPPIFQQRAFSLCSCFPCLVFAVGLAFDDPAIASPQPSCEMSFSSGHTAKATSNSADDKSSALKLLPDTALSLTSSLSSDDQEVLAYLVAVATRFQDIPVAALPSDGGKSVWKPWKNATGSVSDAGKSRPTARKRLGSCSSLPAGVHQPTSGCDCFDCYSYFWSRWDASLHRGIIDNILDLLDHHLDEGQFGLRVTSPQHSRSSEGKKKQDKKKVIEAALSGSKEAASRRGKLSWQKRGRDEKVKEGKAKLQTVVGGTVAAASVALTDEKNGPEVDEKMPLASPLSESSFSQDALPGVPIDAHPSPNGSHTKNGSKQRAGKRKSKQVAPLDCDGEHAEVHEEEEEAVIPVSESATAGVSSVALRIENSSFRGRGFLGRVFPDALGGVATRLWDLVSLRSRRHTTDFY